MKQFYKGIYFLIIILGISIAWGQDCDEGYVPDCSGDGDCCSESWIGDGYCDDENQTWGCNLICYEEEWPDCGGSFPQILVHPEQIFQELEQGDSSTLILTIVNNGIEMPLEWSISNQNDISDWLSLSSYSGFLEPGTLEEIYVTFDSLDLDEGEYNTDIFISSNDPFNEEIIIPVTMVVFNSCFDLSDIYFGECAMELGVGWNGFECEYISGCGWIIDDIDYSDYFFDSIQECEQVCDINNPIDLGDINFDDEINVLDVILLVSFILGEPTDEYEYIAADINEDNFLNVLDVIILIEMILNSTISIQINSGTSYGECFGYCIFELELDNGDAIYKANGWEQYNNEFPDLILIDNLSQNYWQQLVDLIDFEYFYLLDDMYGCPDCADGGAEFIEIIYDGISKQVTFEAYTEIDGIQELTISLRSLREVYWDQINQNHECYIMPEVGPCDGICPTFYYNQIYNECEEFITGCCGVEAFDSMQECQNACE